APRGVEYAERLGDAPADEGAAGGDGSGRTARLLLIRPAQAMLVLIVGVAVDRREDAEVVLAVALEIVVAHADQERRAGQVLHVGFGNELKIVDQRLLVGGGGGSPGHLQSEARG